MRRALVLAACACAAVGTGPRALAQAKRVVRIGVLRAASIPTGSTPLYNLFLDTLRESGWTEGRNLVMDSASAEGNEARLPEVAAALVARKPGVIYVTEGPSARAAARATRTIPIVFHSVPDPVGMGLIGSLARPGGNVTGVATFGGELGARRLQLLRETLPKISRLGVLVTPSTTVVGEQKLIEQAAGTGIRVTPALINTPADFASAFAAFAESKTEAVMITQAALFNRERKAIARLAARHRIPLVGFRSQQVEEGALMSYNSSLADHTVLAARIVAKVLRGEKPADIPVEQPTKFELVINLRTAKSLGIAIPQSILLQADRVIE
jgi:putative ABC transport system substrate-binding protein